MINMEANDVLKLVLGLVLLLAVAIPISVQAYTAQNVLGTATNEQWTGVAGTVHTMAHYVLTVTTNYLSTLDTKTNSTLVTSNDTRSFGALSTAFRSINGTLLVSHDNPLGENISVTFNGYLLGNLTNGATSTLWQIPYTYLSATTNTVNFSYLDATNTTVIRSSQLNYTYWATNTNYTLATGLLTPTVNGTFLTTYNWGTENTGMNLLILTFIATLFCLAALVLIVYWFNGGSV